VEGNCLDISFLLNNDKGNPVFTANTYLEPQWHSRPMPAGLYRSSCYIPGDLLNDDGYSILLYVAKNDTTAIYKHPDLINFRVNDSAERRASFFGKWPGAVRPFLKWETEKLLQDNSLSRQAANNS
jgi:lipopolysaccharide transport system ATP-binding protein